MRAIQAEMVTTYILESSEGETYRVNENTGIGQRICSLVAAADALLNDLEDIPQTQKNRILEAVNDQALVWWLG